MFSNIMRVLLIIGSILTMAFMLRRIRHSKMQIHDSIFWIIFSVLLLTLSVFPELALWVSIMLGIESPINVVFLAIIFCLIVQLFSSTVKISQLDSCVKTLAQQIAVESKLREDAQEKLAKGTKDAKH